MKNIKLQDVKRNWHLIDAKDQPLGRISTNIAHLLLGKNKPYYTPNIDCGDYVVVVNVEKVKLTGNKDKQKPYYHHSGYPGGLKVKTASQVREQNPEKLIRHSIVGMLPKNRLAKQMVKKLHIYKGSEHPYKDKFKN